MGSWSAERIVSNFQQVELTKEPLSVEMDPSTHFTSHVSKNSTSLVLGVFDRKAVNHFSITFCTSSVSVKYSFSPFALPR